MVFKNVVLYSPDPPLLPCIEGLGTRLKGGGGGGGGGGGYGVLFVHACVITRIFIS